LFKETNKKPNTQANKARHFVEVSFFSFFKIKSLNSYYIG